MNRKDKQPLSAGRQTPAGGTSTSPVGKPLNRSGTGVPAGCARSLPRFLDVSALRSHRHPGVLPGETRSSPASYSIGYCNRRLNRGSCKIVLDFKRHRRRQFHAKARYARLEAAFVPWTTGATAGRAPAARLRRPPRPGARKPAGCARPSISTSRWCSKTSSINRLWQQSRRIWPSSSAATARSCGPPCRCKTSKFPSSA